MDVKIYEQPQLIETQFIRLEIAPNRKYSDIFAVKRARSFDDGADQRRKEKDRDKGDALGRKIERDRAKRYQKQKV